MIPIKEIQSISEDFSIDNESKIYFLSLVDDLKEFHTYLESVFKLKDSEGDILITEQSKEEFTEENLNDYYSDVMQNFQKNELRLSKFSKILKPHHVIKKLIGNVLEKYSEYSNIDKVINSLGVLTEYVFFKEFKGLFKIANLIQSNK